MNKLYTFIRTLICLLVIISSILFYRIMTIKEANAELEDKIIKYLDLKDSVDLYTNLLDNANIVENNVKELEKDKIKIDKEVLELTIEINNLKEKIKKLS